MPIIRSGKQKEMGTEGETVCTATRDQNGGEPRWRGRKSRIKWSAHTCVYAGVEGEQQRWKRRKQKENGQCIFVCILKLVGTKVEKKLKGTGQRILACVTIGGNQGGVRRTKKVAHTCMHADIGGNQG